MFAPKKIVKKECKAGQVQLGMYKYCAALFATYFLNLE